MTRLQCSADACFPNWPLVGLFGLGAVLVLLTLLPRNKSRSSALWSLLSLALVAMPLLSGPPGVAVALNYSRNVEFCESCHTPMHSYVADMRDTESETLAAVHYRKQFIPSGQCYACHADSGLAGALHAKLDGIVDLYKYYSATFQTPIVMRRAYANAYCLKCHRNTAKYERVKDHIRYEAALFADKRPCMDCHAEAAPAHQGASSAASERERGQ